MEQDFQEFVMTLMGPAACIVGLIVIICLCYKEIKMEQCLNEAKRMYANNLKTLELLEKELNREKNEEAIFTFPFSEN